MIRLNEIEQTYLQHCLTDLKQKLTRLSKAQRASVNISLNFTTNKIGGIEPYTDKIMNGLKQEKMLNVRVDRYLRTRLNEAYGVMKHFLEQ